MAKDNIPEILPRHIGIIMDGNGRWAKKRGLPRQYGHKQGASVFKKIVRHCKKLGIEYVTFFTFSTENWKRPKKEVDSIMNLLRDYLDDVRGYIDENVRVQFLGDRAPLNDDIRAKMTSLEKDSADFTAMNLNIALNYGGRAEITTAMRHIGARLLTGEIGLDDISEQLISNELYTSGMPEVDLIIRPSGEYRLSNFLIWQSAYAEYVFMDEILWPDFTEKDFNKALDEYSSRDRRFGGI